MLQFLHTVCGLYIQAKFLPDGFNIGGPLLFMCLPHICAPQGGNPLPTALQHSSSKRTAATARAVPSNGSNNSGDVDVPEGVSPETWAALIQTAKDLDVRGTHQQGSLSGVVFDHARQTAASAHKHQPGSLSSAAADSQGPRRSWYAAPCMIHTNLSSAVFSSGVFEHAQQQQHEHTRISKAA
jgi:hypothetical protein